jgi:hypothetical protein
MEICASLRCFIEETPISTSKFLQYNKEAREKEGRGGGHPILT